MKGKYSNLPNDGIFKSSYSHEGLVTQYCRDLQGFFDHIMFACDKTSEQLELLEVLEIPDSEVLAEEVALPSTIFPSDHVRVEATFFLSPCNSNS